MSTLADGAGHYAGPLGLLVVLLLGVALVVLVRSMNKRLANVRERFPQPPPEADDGGSGAGGPA